MTAEKVLENLTNKIGEEMDRDAIIECFEDFEEEDETQIYVGKSHNTNYDYIAYIDTENSTQFLICVDDNNLITDVSIY